jgi:hypothetical protein
VLIVEDSLKSVVDLNAGAEGLAEVVEAPRLDHELLEVDGVVGVLAAVQDVEHGHWQSPRRRPTEVAVERKAGGLCRGFGDGHGDAEDGVGAEFLLVGRAIEVDHDAVDALLVAGIVPFEGGERSCG